MNELSPDMIWYKCPVCEKPYTLADIDGPDCPHCGQYIEGYR